MKSPILARTLACSLAFLAAAPAEAAEIVKISLGEETLEAKIEGPRGDGPYPMIVFAPAQEYLSHERLFAKIAQAANREGFITIRFDWLFTGARQEKGAKAGLRKEPSADLAAEAEQLSILVNELTSSRMMKRYAIDPEKVALVAKGFGGRVAMRPESGGTGAKVKASVLLTPDCGAERPFKKAYAPWIATKIPRLLAISRKDPHCDLAQIYEAAPEFGSTVALFTPGGDHHFVGATAKDLGDQDAVVAATVAWLKDLGWTKGLAPKAAGAKKRKATAADHQHEGHAAGAHPH